MALGKHKNCKKTKHFRQKNVCFDKPTTLNKVRHTAFDRRLGMLGYKLAKEAIFSIVALTNKKTQASQNNKKIVDVTREECVADF